MLCFVVAAAAAARTEAAGLWVGGGSAVGCPDAGAYLWL